MPIKDTRAAHWTALVSLRSAAADGSGRLLYPFFQRVEAQGIADYQKIVNAELSDKLLQYETIKANQAIATSPSSKVIIMGSGRGPTLQVLLTDR